MKREVEMSPSGLFGFAEADRPWWVAHTRSRQEKSLARYLLPWGVPFYLPQREKRVRRASRSLVSHLPLFPGYVFFRGSLGERQTALRSRLIVQVLEVTDQALLQRELSQLHQLQQSGATLVPYEEFRPGDPVRITEGPFEGYSGVVIRPKARLRLMVSITMLRKTVAVEFDREVLTSPPSSRRSSGERQTAVA